MAKTVAQLATPLKPGRWSGLVPAELFSDLQRKHIIPSPPAR